MTCDRVNRECSKGTHSIDNIMSMVLVHDLTNLINWIQNASGGFTVNDSYMGNGWMFRKKSIDGTRIRLGIFREPEEIVLDSHGISHGNHPLTVSSI